MANDRPKLTPGLRLRLGQIREADAEVPIIVRYVPTRRVMRHRGPMIGVRESYNYRLQPFVHMHATPGAIRQLEADPDVVRIYEDLPVRALLDSALPRVRVPAVWEDGLTGEGVRIAIVDTGIDATHPDFQGRIVAVTDFTGEGNGDRSGHGTHCASIAAGSGTAGGGKYRGVAYKASIYAAKVLKADGSGMMSDVMAGIEWAVNQGVHIISLSLGAPGPSDGSDALCETCDAAVAAGVMLCAAAGNEGPQPYTVGSPGAARNVLTIGAVNDQDRMANFSSRGPTSDGRTKPDVVLPGVDIIAARASGTRMGAPVDNYYTSASGTSMATPIAAGICALLLQREPQLKPAQIKQRLMSTALDIGAGPQAQGSGRVDAWRVLHPEALPEPTPAPEPTPVPSPGEGCLPALIKVLFGGK